jgi:hypothetical protein
MKRYVRSEANILRVKLAHGALSQFADAARQNLPLERDDVVVDMLCDMRHYCAHHDMDWRTLVARAAAHFAIERKGEE